MDRYRPLTKSYLRLGEKNAVDQCPPHQTKFFQLHHHYDERSPRVFLLEGLIQP